MPDLAIVGDWIGIDVRDMRRLQQRRRLGRKPARMARLERDGQRRALTQRREKRLRDLRFVAVSRRGESTYHPAAFRVMAGC